MKQFYVVPKLRACERISQNKNLLVPSLLRRHVARKTNPLVPSSPEHVKESPPPIVIPESPAPAGRNAPRSRNRPQSKHPSTPKNRQNQNLNPLAAASPSSPLSGGRAKKKYFCPISPISPILAL